MCQNFIRKRAKKGGVIVNISSIEGGIPFKEDMASYVYGAIIPVDGGFLSA